MPARNAIAETSTVPWQELHDLLQEIDALAKSRCTADEFAETVCRQTRQVLEVEAVAIWQQDASRAWRRLATSADASLSTDPQWSPGASDPNQATIVGQFTIDSERSGAVEVVLGQPPEGSRSIPGEVVDALAEVVADYFRARRIDELCETDTTWRHLVDIIARLHASLEPDAVAYQIANDGRAWLGADRVCVFSTQSGRPRLVAMSGVDRLDRRSDLVQAFEDLCAKVSRTGEALWYDGQATALAPEVDRALHRFLEHSPARNLAVIPLRPLNSNGSHEAALSGMLTVEHFEQLPHSAALRQRLHFFAPQAAQALTNAAQHDRIPWARMIDRVAARGGRSLMRKLTVAAVIVGALVLALSIIPADFKVEARGELQPALRRDIFAPADGVIAEVLVDHGQTVSKDAALVRIVRPPLELETVRVNGELQTAQKKLAATRALQVELDRSGTASIERRHQLTADEQELEALIRSLESQRAILDAQASELEVRSPFQGSVLTWNVESLLASRPVQQGQYLMTVGDTCGRWELLLKVNDDRIGHVLEQAQEGTDRVGVSFVLATDPNHEYQTQIESIAQTAESDEHNRPTVTVTAMIAPEVITEPRPGAEVIAHIHCGTRSLGYVWFHDIIDAVRGWISY